MSVAVSTSLVRERGIIFSGESVRAISEGRKTVTRRVVKGAKALAVDVTEFSLRGYGGWVANDAAVVEQGADMLPAPYAVGDRLWVRETFRIGDGANESDDPRKPTYAADWPDAAVKWTSPIYMPRALSRLALEIASVRVERLHAITEEDCVAEGVKRTEAATYIADGAEFETARTAFEFGWEGINGKRAPWETNPWVFRIEFRRVA